MQQRLLYGGGGGVIHCHSTDGAVLNTLQYDDVQQGALSELSGMRHKLIIVLRRVGF